MTKRKTFLLIGGIVLGIAICGVSLYLIQSSKEKKIAQEAEQQRQEFRKKMNLWEVHSGTLKKGMLYRGVSPFTSPNLGGDFRSLQRYAKEISDTGIKTIIDFGSSRNQAAATKWYAGEHELFYTDTILPRFNVFFAGTDDPAGWDITSMDFNLMVSKALRFISANPGPYLICSRDGDDLISPLILMIQSLCLNTLVEITRIYLDEMTTGYARSHNTAIRNSAALSGVEPTGLLVRPPMSDLEAYNAYIAEVSKLIAPGMKALFHVEDPSEVDWYISSEQYLFEIGMGRADIERFKKQIYTNETVSVVPDYDGGAISL